MGQFVVYILNLRIFLRNWNLKIIGNLILVRATKMNIKRQQTMIILMLYIMNVSLTLLNLY